MADAAREPGVRTFAALAWTLHSAAAVVWVETRGAHGDLLHRTVAAGMAELRRVVGEADRELPTFVWKELDRYVGCGDPERGLAWLVCQACDGHRLVPFPARTAPCRSAILRPQQPGQNARPLHFHGVYWAHAAWRAEVVSSQDPAPPAAADGKEEPQELLRRSGRAKMRAVRLVSLVRGGRPTPRWRRRGCRVRRRGACLRAGPRRRRRPRARPDDRDAGRAARRPRGDVPGFTSLTEGFGSLGEQVSAFVESPVWSELATGAMGHVTLVETVLAGWIRGLAGLIECASPFGALGYLGSDAFARLSDCYKAPIFDVLVTFAIAILDTALGPVGKADRYASQSLSSILPHAAS